MMHFKPRRRWLQFSVRTLIVLVTLFAVWLGLQATGRAASKWRSL